MSAIVIDEAEAMDLFNRGFPVALRPVPKPGEKPSTPFYNSVALGNWGDRSFTTFRDNPRWWGDVPTEWVRPTVGRRTKDEAAGHIFRREPFEIGNISGTPYFDVWSQQGDLPAGWVSVLKHGNQDHGGYAAIAYVVWSYETIVAWVYNDGHIVMPPVRYSNTTTQHQHLIARALGVPFTTTESARKGKGKTPYTSRSGW